MSNLFGNDLSAVTTENGLILDNIAKQVVVTESVLTLKPDKIVTAVHISPYGKSILNETSISSLRNKILDADTAIEISDNGVGEINFDVDNVLKLQVTSANTTVKNNLLVDNIKDETGNQSVNITSGQLTLQRPKITFRDSAFTNRGYLQTQNSGSTHGNNTTGYLEWYTGRNSRCAYMGLGGSNDLVSYNGKSISLALENGCNFRIAEGAVEIFKVSVEDDIITANYEFNINVAGGDNTFGLYKCPGGEQVSLYSHSGLNEGFLIQKSSFDDGVKINMFHNGIYKPMYFNSANSSQMVIGSEAVQTDTERFVVISSSRFKMV